MAVRLLNLISRKNVIRFPTPLGSAGAHDNIRCVIGNREIVGFGVNGEPEYVDRVDFPFPSVRWQETSPNLVALREKEKGDWRKLTIQEKKSLYRASFGQTFSEFTHPTGEWKSIIGAGCFLVSIGVWLYIYMKLYVYGPLPDSFSDKNQRAQLRRMLDLRVNEITGIASKWDYETAMWKK